MKTHNAYDCLFLYQGESRKQLIVPAVIQVLRSLFHLLAALFACMMVALIIAMTFKFSFAATTLLLAGLCLVIGLLPLLRFKLTLVQALLLPFVVKILPNDNEVPQKVARVGKLDIYVMSGKRRDMWQPYKPQPSRFARKPLAEDVKATFLEGQAAQTTLIDHLLGKR